MTGAFKVNSWIAFFAAFGVILSAAYALRLYRQVMFGDLTKQALMEIPDLDRRELGSLVVLMFFALYLGFNPGPALSVFSPSVDLLMDNFQASLAAGGE